MARLALLAGIVGAAGLVAWVLNEKSRGPAGAELAVFSAVTCGISAGVALLVVGMTTGGQQASLGCWSQFCFELSGHWAPGLSGGCRDPTGRWTT